MTDQTEKIRRVQQALINEEAAKADDPEVELKAKYGQLWNTSELQKEFTVRGFLAPYVTVTRKLDGANGSMLFSHRPRFYHSFKED
tara:strand:+ start:29 stop:286 length:258 start_codon:yes stop_codon:yes gene_type:complete